MTFTVTTTIAANDNVDTWLPGASRTVPDVPTYLANNTVFNVMDYGAYGDGSHDDTTEIQAAFTAAGAVSSSGAFGAEVYFPPGTYLISAQISSGPGVVARGAGARASRILSSYSGFAIKFGGTGSTLAYGCGIRDISFNMTNTTGGAIWSYGTAGFFTKGLYIEGVVNGGCTGIFIDGANSSNIFSKLDNIVINHVKFGVHYGTSGSVEMTSCCTSSVSVLCDSVAGSIGFQIDASNGQGSTWHGGNIEACATGISISGLACSFFGMRSETGTNTVDLILNSGAKGNTFVGCYGWGVVTDNSGNLNNGFFGNYDGTGVHYPPDQLSTTLIFGQNGATLTENNTGPIANNGTVTIPVPGHLFEMTLTESGNQTACKLLITPIAGIPVTIATATAPTLYSTTPGTAGKINFGYTGGNLTIENKTGSSLTIWYTLMMVRS